MITSRNDIQKLLKEFLKAQDFYTINFCSDDNNLKQTKINYFYGPLVGKILEKDSQTLEVLKDSVTDEALRKELQLYKKMEVNELDNLDDYVQKYISCYDIFSEIISLSKNKKRTFVFLDIAYRNYFNELNCKFNSDLSRVNQSFINILNNERQFSKYKLVPIGSDRELIMLDPPRFYDKVTDTTFYINNISLSLLSILNKMKNSNIIKDLSVRINNEPGMRGRHAEMILQEELERGQYLNFTNIDKIPITKLYSKNLSDNLWVKIDNQNITFEEFCDDFDIYEDTIATQVIHLEYLKDNNNCYITHLDHEYVFYTEDEYLKRQINYKQKGMAKERIKSFKIDNSHIPLNYVVNVQNKNVNGLLILQKELFLYYVLDCYFKHKDLLNEYFQNVK